MKNIHQLSRHEPQTYSDSFLKHNHYHGHDCSQILPGETDRQPILDTRRQELFRNVKVSILISSYFKVNLLGFCNH